MTPCCQSVTIVDEAGSGDVFADVEKSGIKWDWGEEAISACAVVEKRTKTGRACIMG